MAAELSEVKTKEQTPPVLTKEGESVVVRWVVLEHWRAWAGRLARAFLARDRCEQPVALLHNQHIYGHQCVG